MTDTSQSQRPPAHAAGDATRRPHHARAAMLAVVLALPLAAAACGGSKPPGVANLGTSTSTGTAGASGAPSGSDGGTSLDRYAACMRAHGVTQYPDPINGGNAIVVHPGDGLNPSSPIYAAAQSTCHGLLPQGGAGDQGMISPADQPDYLRAAACMRAHGITDFPDPVFSGGRVHFNLLTSLDRTAAAVVRAETTCRKLIPSGLPYSS